MQKLVSNSNLKIDKNLAFNILEFNNIEDSQVRNIIKSLLIYFSFQYQEDLFGYKSLDVESFSKKMNIHKTTLNRKVKYKDELSKYGDEALKWSTYLEQALFILASKPVFSNYKGKVDVENSSYTYTGIQNFLILKEVRKVEVFEKKNGNNGGKKPNFYEYKLDEVFERNLREFFFLIELENFFKTKKIGGDDFYLNLKSIYYSESSKGNNSYRYDFNYITNYFNVQNPEVKKQKFKVNAIFKKLEELFATEIKGIKFYWEKKTDNCKYAYVPCVRWDLDKEEFKRRSLIEIENVFLNDLKRTLYDIFRTQLPDYKDEDFKDWFGDPSNDDVIKSAYVSIFLKYKARSKYPTPETLSSQFITKRNELRKAGVSFKTLFIATY